MAAKRQADVAADRQADMAAERQADMAAKRQADVAAERQADAAVADMNGPHALPRRSGEMVFHHEWERRAFAMAVALHEQGHFHWDEFRQHLIAEIAASGETAEHPDPAAPGYFEHWLASLEKVLAGKGLAR